MFTEHFRLTPAQFSYLFAANSVALVLGGHVGNVLLRRGVHPRHTLYIGIALHGLAGLGLYLIVQAGGASLEVYIALLALAVGALGLIFGNLTALTMASAGRQVGVASALMGSLHYLLSAVIGYLASLAAAGPAALPAAIAVCAALAGGLCLVASRLAGRAGATG
ncbi:bicyclomycin resistance protein (transporter) [Bordetella trematum]|nr:bicyclomycin resistance protein (transporter) [Bordetella trematum]